MGGKSVIAVSDGQNADESPRYLYATDDIIWIVEAPEPELTRIFAALP